MTSFTPDLYNAAYCHRGTSKVPGDADDLAHESGSVIEEVLPFHLLEDPHNECWPVVLWRSSKHPDGARDLVISGVMSPDQPSGTLVDFAVAMPNNSAAWASRCSWKTPQ